VTKSLCQQSDPTRISVAGLTAQTVIKMSNQSVNC
jgi:hypothetical protein